MIKAGLAPKGALLVGLTTFVVTFLASRGVHSPVHEFLAVVAMGLEVALVICSALGRRRAAVVLLVAVVICWLTAFVTDGFCLNAYRNLTRALSSFF